MTEEKQTAYKRWLHLRTTEDYIEYKQLSAKTQKQIRKRRRLSREKFITQMEHNLYKPKPSTYKILKHLNQETRETRDNAHYTKSYAYNITRNCGLIQTINRNTRDPTYMKKK
jgi:hypothetical protein